MDVEKSVLISGELVVNFLFLSDVEKSVRTPRMLGEDRLALLDVEKSVLTLNEIWEGLPDPGGRGEVRPDP
jgi:hypothetical protein